jgi:hypothetical protein
MRELQGGGIELTVLEQRTHINACDHLEQLARQRYGFEKIDARVGVIPDLLQFLATVVRTTFQEDSDAPIPDVYHVFCNAITEEGQDNE